MIKDPETGALSPIRFENILEEVPELKRFGYNFSTYSFNPPIDSSNIKPSVWIKIADLIEKNYTNYDGFIILHGTDTMAFSASALSFMLENLSKPVIFTGSQLPLGSIRTDGKDNLISAVEIASARVGENPIVPEVAIFFENKLFRGNRTSKNNVEEFNAFQSYNYPTLADSGVHIRFNYPAILSPEVHLTLKVHKVLDTNIVILKLFPGIRKEVAKAIFTIPGLKGIIIETYGAGNAPVEKWFLDEIKRAINKDIYIVGITQCPEGSVEMGMYETSVELEDAGVISGRDITTEAAVTKLMYLLGRNLDREQMHDYLNNSIAGEITVL